MMSSFAYGYKQAILAPCEQKIRFMIMKTYIIFIFLWFEQTYVGLIVSIYLTMFANYNQLAHQYVIIFTYKTIDYLLKMLNSSLYDSKTKVPYVLCLSMYNLNVQNIVSFIN